MYTLLALTEVITALIINPNCEPTIILTIPGLMYCIEFLEKNIEWLLNKLSEIDGMISIIEI